MAAAKQPDERWRRLEPHLEDAMARLSDAERDAVLLRYFQDLSLGETGASLGVSAGAAAKRVSRGLQKLREFFARKGVAMPEVTLGEAIASGVVEAAPVGLAAAVVNVAGASGTAAPVLLASSQRVLRAMAAAKVKVAAGGAQVVLVGTAAVAPQFLPRRGPVTTVAPPAADVVPAAELRKTWDAAWNASRIAPGWPVALPGAVTGTPTPADLDGDGKFELLVPCMHGPGRGPVVHPRPGIERQLFAFHADGRPVRGWPAVISDRPTRLAQIERGGFSEDWSSSPSVMDWDGDGRDEVVILDRAGTVAVEHESDGPEVIRLAPEGDGIGTAPLADVNGDGVVDLVMGHVLTTVDGGGVRGWSPERRFVGGFAPAIGDANGDGRMEVYHPFFANAGTLGGFDASGRPLPGWPQKVSGQCQFAPVLGDVDGDGMLEVVAAHGPYLSVWRWDGTPAEGATSAGVLRGVLKQGISAGLAAPTVVDLDGDGADEVIVFDRRDRAVKAWRGNGAPLRGTDGTVAHLPEADCWGGVTVADLGGDGVMDLFVATYWVQLAPDGRTTVTPMLPEAAATTTQGSICDVGGDGAADVVFGLSDGRVFVYETGMACRAEWMYWPTQSGNFRHTGTAAARRPVVATRRPE